MEARMSQLEAELQSTIDRATRAEAAVSVLDGIMQQQAATIAAAQTAAQAAS